MSDADNSTGEVTANFSTGCVELRAKPKPNHPQVGTLIETVTTFTPAIAVTYARMMIDSAKALGWKEEDTQ